jgi:hypothetical protein
VAAGGAYANTFDSRVDRSRIQGSCGRDGQTGGRKAEEKEQAESEGQICESRGTMKSPGTVFLREMKVVLRSGQEFCFLSKNKVSFMDGKAQHIYQRQRRGARITWFDFLAESMEPEPVTGELLEQLELAYTQMEDEKQRVMMEKYIASAKKLKP